MSDNVYCGHNRQSLLDSLGGTEVPLATEEVSPEEDELLRTSEVGVSNAEIQQAAKQDLDLLAALAMPTVFKYLFPDVYKKGVWPWLISYVHTMRTFPQLALGLPRGFAKTTFMKLFLLYVILFTKRKFILVAAANATLAQNIVSDVMDMLEEPNIKKVFGDWKLGAEQDTQAIKKFGYRGRNIIIAAIGAEGSLRGLNLKHSRPDVMIFDDIQSRDCADSQVQSDSLERWMVGTAMKAKSPDGCMFLFLGNMYPTKHSILRKLKKNRNWVKFITGGILADGTSLWEDLQPVAQLYREFENDLEAGHPEIFFAEVLNDENASANSLIDLSRLPDLPYEEGDIPQGNFIIIDPSTDKSRADNVAIGYFEVYDGSPVLRKLKADRMSPGETIRNALHFALTYNCRLVLCEANAYQYTFLYWFQFMCQQLGIVGIECAPIYSGIKSKNSRILTAIRSYAEGEIFIAEECQAEVHLEITQFNPLKTDNTDDVLDLLAYAPKVLSEFGEHVKICNLIDQQEFEAIEVPELNTCF